MTLLIICFHILFESIQLFTCPTTAPTPVSILKPFLNYAGYYIYFS